MNIWNTLFHTASVVVLLLGPGVHGYWDRPKSTKIDRGKSDAKCDYIVTIPNGHVTYEDKNKLNHIGKRINFSCDKGYQLVGNSTALCQNLDHQWSAQTPTCRLWQCEHLQGLQHGRITEYSNLPGGKVSFVCDEGYRRVGGSATIYCNPATAEWTDSQPTCQPDKCPSIILFPHGQVLNYNENRNSKINFVCDPKYELNGPSEVKCMGPGPSWSSPIPQCVCKDPWACEAQSELEGPKCPTLISIPNGFFTVIKGDGVIKGSRVRVECNNGWLLKMTDGELTMYSRSMKCTQYGWDIPVPECIERHCPKKEIMPFGYIMNATQNYPGATIKVRCYKGYVVRGGKTAVHCGLDGTWSEPTECYLPKCPDILRFPNGYVDKYSNLNSYSNGTRSKFRCDEGYTLVGKPSTRCSLKGKWENPPPICVFGFATCVAHGDPHYRSFDEQKLTFMGTCKYTLASTCGKAPNGLMEFNVEAKNFPGLSPTNKPVSFTKYLTVDIAGHRIKLGPGKEVIIGKAKKVGPYTIMTDGEALNLPVMGIQDMPGLTIKISGRFLELRTEKGFVVRIDEYSKADITVPAAYANIGLCGICGNFDMMPSNDLLTKDGEEITKRVQKKNREVLKYDWLKLGNSYEVPGPESEPGCMATVDPDPDCGSEEEEQQVESACGVMTDVNGLFKKCIETIGIHRIEEKFLSCKYDACLVVDREDMICQALADFADTCTEEGVPVSWRNKTFCPLACRENEEYHPLTTACPDTCNSVKESANNCPEEDREGCACVEGYVLSNAQCIPKKECGCTDDLNRYFPAGESYISGDCSANVTCQDDGKFGSTPLPACHEKAHCGYKDGQRGCTCNDGYEGDGITYCNPAVDPGTCICAGDPYYQTFDNGKLEFQGLCTYTLVEPCDGAEWSVKVENKKTNFGERSYGHRIHVDAHGHSFTLEEFQKFAVDGQEKENLVMDKLNVTHVGNAIVLQTDFGLKVSYDGRGSTGRHVASVTISNVDYYNKLCGICGNWNGNIVDDFVAKDSTGVATSTDVGNSWKTDDPCPVNAA